MLGELEFMNPTVVLRTEVGVSEDTSGVAPAALLCTVDCMLVHRDLSMQLLPACSKSNGGNRNAGTPKLEDSASLLHTGEEG